MWSESVAESGWLRQGDDCGTGRLKEFPDPTHHPPRAGFIAFQIGAAAAEIESRPRRAHRAAPLGMQDCLQGVKIIAHAAPWHAHDFFHIGSVREIAGGRPRHGSATATTRPGRVSRACGPSYRPYPGPRPSSTTGACHEGTGTVAHPCVHTSTTWRKNS